MRIRDFLAAALVAFVIAFALLLCGCKSTDAFVEGTRFRAGLYVPWDGQLYGLQLVEYLNGTATFSQTNSAISIDRQFSSTNSYFGIIHTIDSTKTRVEKKIAPCGN